MNIGGSAPVASARGLPGDVHPSLRQCVLFAVRVPGEPILLSGKGLTRHSMLCEVVPGEARR
jgi:hypothetical protein